MCPLSAYSVTSSITPSHNKSIAMSQTEDTDRHEHHDELADIVTDESAAKAKAAAAKSAIGAGSASTGRRRVRVTSMNDASEVIKEVDDVLLHEGEIVHVPVVKGEFTSLPASVQQFIAEYVSISI